MKKWKRYEMPSAIVLLIAGLLGIFLWVMHLKNEAEVMGQQRVDFCRDQKLNLAASSKNGVFCADPATGQVYYQRYP